MTSYKRLILPLVLLGGAAVAAGFAARMRQSRRQEEKAQREEELHDWEGEGGNQTPPAVTPQSP